MRNGKAEFDDIASRYNAEVVENLGSFDRFRDSMLYYKSRYLKYLLPETPKAILDYGCGIGMNMPYLREYFPDTELFGCDISRESILLAKENVKGCAFYAIETAEDLKIYKDKIDCVFISCVLHHIPFEEHEKWIGGLYNVLKKGGHMVIFENNMKNPLTRKFVEKIPLDKNARMLDAAYGADILRKAFGAEAPVKLGYAYFFPWRNRIFTWIEHKLFRLPLGAQYYVIAKK
jgi:ubiquinone/menaquinone biosynthesis C-methylase UbiE